MKVRITHKPGYGPHPFGAVVEMDDRRARGVIAEGYVEEVAPVLVKKKKDEAT